MEGSYSGQSHRRFYSLQTGRRFQTSVEGLIERLGQLVSIPFKREGVSKHDEAEAWLDRKHVSIPFHREGVSKLTDLTGKDVEAADVSIPFHREGVSKPRLQCQFDFGILVSIPFKREGVSKL